MHVYSCFQHANTWSFSFTGMHSLLFTIFWFDLNSCLVILGISAYLSPFPSNLIHVHFICYIFDFWTHGHVVHWHENSFFILYIKDAVWGNSFSWSIFQFGLYACTCRYFLQAHWWLILSLWYMFIPFHLSNVSCSYIDVSVIYIHFFARGIHMSFVHPLTTAEISVASGQWA